MKKEIVGGLIVTVIGGFVVYWATQGIPELRSQQREQEQRAELARQEEARRQQYAEEAEKHRARMSAPEPDIDRNGGDYKDFVSQDLDACLRACEAEESCKAVTFNKSSRQCWMKSTVPLRRDNPLFISAVKVGA